MKTRLAVSAALLASAAGQATVVRVGSVSLASSHGAGVAPGQAVTVLIRPERVRLAPPANDGPGCNVLAGRATDVVYLGEELQVSVETEGPMALTVNLKAIDTDKELVPGAAVIYDGPGATIIELP